MSTHPLRAHILHICEHAFAVPSLTVSITEPQQLWLYNLVSHLESMRLVQHSDLANLSAIDWTHWAMLLILYNSQPCTSEDSYVTLCSQSTVRSLVASTARGLGCRRALGDRQCSSLLCVCVNHYQTQLVAVSLQLQFSHSYVHCQSRICIGPFLSNIEMPSTPFFQQTGSADALGCPAG